MVVLLQFDKMFLLLLLLLLLLVAVKPLLQFSAATRT
jgi:hypothetical protein